MNWREQFLTRGKTDIATMKNRRSTTVEDMKQILDFGYEGTKLPDLVHDTGI